jgi:hypothetical protein
MLQTDKTGHAHIYLQLWITCRNIQGEGPRLLPEAGGVLDQDYMTMWAFDVIDTAYREEQQIEQQRQESLKKYAELMNTLKR